MDAVTLPPTTPAISADDAEMAQQVQMEVEPDLDTQIWSELDIDECFEQERHADAAEMDQQEQGDLSADLDANIDDAGSLFGDEPQHPSSPKLGDAARQHSVQPAASQAQGSMSGEVSRPTGLALPRLALPKPAPAQPAPVVVAEQPQVVEPVVTGPLGKKRAGPKGKGKEKAYSGARVPEQSAGQATVQPATAPYELGIPRDEDLLVSSEVFQQTLDDCLGPLDGDIEQQVAAAPAPAPPAENDLFMADDNSWGFSPADGLAAPEQGHVPSEMGQYGAEIDFAGLPDLPIDLTTAEPRFAAQQQAPSAAMAYQGAEIAQALPPPPPQPPLFSGSDDVDLDFAAGKWGRWHPKSMCGMQYVVQDRCPYDDNNPRDLYDYLQAVVAAIVRPWPGRFFEKPQGRGRPAVKQERHPTDPALWWMGKAWRRLCDSFIAQQEEKYLWLSVDVQTRLSRCMRFVQEMHLNGDDNPEQTIETVMAALIEMSKMPGGVLQQGLSQQQAIVIE